MTLKSFGFVSTLALVSALASPAYAQDNAPAQGDAAAAATTTTNATNAAQPANTDSDTGTRNQEIVVTAEFRQANLQDTPIAITAVNAAMLEARGQTDVSQIAAQAPNVTLAAQPQGGGIGLIAYIRGIGQTDFDYALDPGVGLYVDDVYIPTLSSSLMKLMDLDRVEVLRGPQGTLAGKNSIGGAIKLFSAKPTGSGEGYLEAGYGSFNQINVRGMADFALTNNLFARISGISMSHDGWVDVVDYGLTHPTSNVPANNARGAYHVTNHLGSQHVTAGRLALRWQPSDALEVNVSADYTDEHGSAGPEVLIAAGNKATSAATFDPSITNPNPATNANGGAWLPGKNGQPVPVDCHFVPFGQYSCDTGGTLPSGVDPRYMTYANFLDGMTPTQQAPYKPYAALQNSDFKGWGVMGNVKYTLSDAFNLTFIIYFIMLHSIL